MHRAATTTPLTGAAVAGQTPLRHGVTCGCLSRRHHHFKHHRAKREAERQEAAEKAEAQQHAEANKDTLRQRQQEQAAEEWAEGATM